MNHETDTKMKEKWMSCMLPQELSAFAKREKYKRLLIQKKFSRAETRFQKDLEHGHRLSARDNEDLIELLRENSNSAGKSKMFMLMLEEQQKAALTNKYNMRWHPDILQWAAKMRSKSASCYEAFRISGFFALPYATTVQSAQ